LQKLTDTEKAFVTNAQSSGARNAYLAQLAEDVKVMRAGLPPQGVEIVETYIPRGKDISLTFAPSGGAVSKSGDLGYTYGSYELLWNGQVKEKGFYSHIWKRDSKGNWRIVVSNIEEVKPKKAS